MIPTTRGPELMTVKAHPYVDFDPLVCMKPHSASTIVPKISSGFRNQITIHHSLSQIQIPTLSRPPTTALYDVLCPSTQHDTQLCLHRRRRGEGKKEKEKEKDDQEKKKSKLINYRIVSKPEEWQQPYGA